MKITLAIHTYRYAIRLKRALEQAGIQVWLQDVNTGSENIEQNKVYAGIRVRIDEKDLPTALHLVEHDNLFVDDSDAGRCILVPVDFSRRGMRACLTAARIALRGEMTMVLLHACPTPYFEGSIPESDMDNNLLYNDNPDVEIEEVQEAKTIQSNAAVEMKRYLRQLRKYCSDAGLDNLPKIRTEVQEGVPEEVIAQYYKDHSVSLVVMSTRDTTTRSAQLIGSVTAEVIDNAHISVLTIPDIELDSHSIFSNVMLLCNLDQGDLLLADYVMRLGHGVENLHAVIVPVNEHAQDTKERAQRLTRVLKDRYPECKFSYLLSGGNLDHEDLKQLIKASGFTLVALSNKRRNILSRIFNPGLAHKVLFTNDVPLFALSSDESI